jgi:hypothetical protein
MPDVNAFYSAKTAVCSKSSAIQCLEAYGLNPAYTPQLRKRIRGRRVACVANIPGRAATSNCQEVSDRRLPSRLLASAEQSNRNTCHADKDFMENNHMQLKNVLRATAAVALLGLASPSWASPVTIGLDDLPSGNFSGPATEDGFTLTATHASILPLAFLVSGFSTDN